MAKAEQNGGGTFVGRVIIVTGASSGIGAACARGLAAEGASVILTARGAAAGNETAASIAAAGGKAVFMEQDVVSPESWGRVIAATLEKFGRVDGLVNNAGAVAEVMIENTDLQEFRAVHQANLHSVFLGMTHAVKAMRRHGDGGSIINVASTASITGSPTATAYCASKGGVRFLSQAAARELAADKIRVNTVSPGPVDTPLARRSPLKTPESRAFVTSLIPVKRVGVPEDVATAVVFLMSDSARHITGSMFTIDGGLTAQ